MTDETTFRDDSGGTAFAGLDPRLTIYALANGMDLDRGPGFRRLAWFRDGLERGILVEEGRDGTVSISAVAWAREAPEGVRKTTRGAALTPQTFVRDLSALLEDTVNAANAL